jgi:putative hydrolase of HD superfamily
MTGDSKGPEASPANRFAGVAPTKRWTQQLAFLAELDKLKEVMRRNRLANGTRYENTAEHSWHLGVMAMVLREYAPSGDVDPWKAMAMALFHDVVEIDAGDTFCYDVAGHEDKAEREQAAATRLFGLLPQDQTTEFHALWEEFEAGRTGTAQYARALDRLNPFMLNFLSKGGSWAEHGITDRQVFGRMAEVKTALPAAWPLVEAVVAEATANGWIKAATP